jgi:hypothetical protein
MRPGVLTVVTSNITVLRETALFSPVMSTDVSEEHAASILLLHPEDGNRILLRNYGKLLSDLMMSHLSTVIPAFFLPLPLTVNFRINGN